MKHYYRGIFVALLAGFILWPAQRANAQASDTLVVEWADANGDVIVNALRDAILNDTERPEGRVYKLRQGGYYWNSDRIENAGFHLRIVGEKGGATEFDNPPVLQMVSRPDGSNDGRLITGLSSLTLKNLYIPGANQDGTQTFYEPITNNASNSRFVIENVVFERSNFSMMSFYGTNNDIFFRDCKFRNLIGEPSSQQWEGRGISIWADQDTVIVENCTFFNVGMTAFQLEGGAANYILFAHNTLVNVGRSINAGNWWREAYFVNNLLINTFWHGEGSADLNSPGRNPRATSAGMFSIGALPSVYGPEQGRRVLLANTASWRDPAFTTFYGDTIVAQPFANPVTNEDFFDVYDNIVARDTTWLGSQPNLTTYPDELLPDMWANITDLRRGIIPATPYFWMLPVFDDERCHVCVNWPLPEDFSYTDAQLLTASTNGLPLGDLNWFPDAKADWLANRDAYVAAIQALAGPVISFEVVGTAEAEDGALSGDAEIQVFEGFSYFQMDGGGFIQWTFDMPDAGTVELVVYTNLRGNSDRGQRIIVNGVNIRNNSGYGEYFWSASLGDPTNEWFESRITQAGLIEGADALNLQAGENVIRIEPSWGYQNFSGIDVILNGEVVAELRAPDAVYSIVTPIGEGADYTPSGFKAVALNTSGGVSWSFNAPTNGIYRIQAFYQAPNGTQSVEVSVDGQVVLPAFVLEGEAGDAGGRNLLSDGFQMSAGVHEVSVSGSDIILDFVQLIREVSTSVWTVNDQLPGEFALHQNYPNPFNPNTTIRFALAKASDVQLTIYNVLGQKVATLVDGRMNPGIYAVQFEASQFASGVYFYRIDAGDFVTQRRMLLLK